MNDAICHAIDAHVSLKMLFLHASFSMLMCLLKKNVDKMWCWPIWCGTFDIGAIFED